MKMNRALVLLLVFLSLSACSWLGLGDDTEAKKQDTEAKQEEAADKKKLPICPQVAIIRDLEYMDDYGTEKPDPSQLVAQGHLKAVTGDCGYVKNGIDIAFELSLASRRGPRLGGSHTSFPFFVAIVDPEQNILSKESMTAEFKFASDSTVAETAENLHVFIPLDKSKRATGPGYRVLIGFQIPEEQRETPTK